MGRPAKRAKLLSDSADSESSGDDVQNGVRLPDANSAAKDFTINEEYAKRFEYNKKREERHRLEEKYNGLSGSKRAYDEDDEDEDSEDDESEDDDAELATADLDAEIMDTLQAIQTKDPRVYDSSVKFYKDFEKEEENERGSSAANANGQVMDKKDKPMYLQDYHRQNLMAGHAGEEFDDSMPVQTYQQEQDELKRQLVGEMHAGAAERQPTSGMEEDGFLVKKSKPKHESLPAATKAKSVKITEHDVAAAEKDPESYLSNFMAARAWLPTDSSHFQAFESDDSEDDTRADEFEDAYNMRFEDPQKANEKLQSFARDVGKYSVRRDEKSGRKGAREREREKKTAEKREREEERARLRKLKIEEAEEKINQIKRAAGLRGEDVDFDQWRDVIEADFDDEQWDQEMKHRFGEDYYAGEEAGHGSDEGDLDSTPKKRKLKKPKWDDDIDITDIIPEYQDDDGQLLVMSDPDEVTDGGAPLSIDEGAEAEVSKKGSKKASKKDREKAKSDAKRAARKQRMKIEEMVDENLATSLAPASSKLPVARFQYRETSPTSFGLTARDILFADDRQLNEFAGLKKIATWRDPDKKARDKKKLSKKARLREWRKDTFGNAEGPVMPEAQTTGVADIGDNGAGEERTGKKRRKRKSKSLQAT